MRDNTTNQNITFEYSYSAKRQEEIESIRKKYLPEQEDKLQQLQRLDKSVERPGTILALIVGIMGTLLFGTGMSCLLVWTEQYFVQGIIVGFIGILIIIGAYPLFKKITDKRREKLAPQILALSEELLK